MIDTNETYSEPLYLDKENKNYIYINDCQNLKQYQIDGLRFLYRQFKKRKPGAVINFPPGSGKSHIITLFLNAVSSLLKERTLILCTDDDEIEHWKELFLSLTGYSIDDIAIESSNPRLKKKVFLKKIDDLSSYSRCNWCVVIIKDNMCKSLQKISIDADFKIWITSTDIMKDHSLLSFINKWMFPKSKIDLNDILYNEVRPENKLKQALVLDSFLNDFVIRENNVPAISDTENTRILQNYKEINKRKNKDATGTKLKRSKPNIHSDGSDEPNILKHIPSDNIKEETIKTSISESNDSADVRIKIEAESHEDCSSLHIESDTCNKSSDIYMSNKINGASETQKFNEAIRDIIINENKSETIDESTESLDVKEQDSYYIAEQKSDNILEVNNVDNFPAVENDRNLNENATLEDVHISERDVKVDADMDLNESIATEKSERDQNVLQQKISELEERTMKKFKGSLLDSIF
ncbi:uncharacterized protein LOC116773986 [Danaus plexippus]|uniref:uncharacterized protein LOC116773986 n=1 Tax=Danaus plexippus TaxID=13037 RepID=UPI002AAF17D2|nr:uncharacterized protein LOC116773986 [Danaus plexippus]